MSTAVDPRRQKSGERLLTIADVAVLPDDLPSGPVLYELDNGRLVVMPPPGDIHGGAVSQLVGHLLVQGEWRGHGKVRSGDVGVILRRDPDRLVGSDALFIANRSLPIVRSPEGYLVTIPDLVAEVKSKNDSRKKVLSKVEDYLTAGVTVVWVGDPAARTVTVYRRGVEPQVLTENDTLTVEDIIPGFQVQVRDLFRD